MRRTLNILKSTHKLMTKINIVMRSVIDSTQDLQFWKFILNFTFLKQSHNKRYFSHIQWKNITGYNFVWFQDSQKQLNETVNSQKRETHSFTTETRDSHACMFEAKPVGEKQRERSHIMFYWPRELLSTRHFVIPSRSDSLFHSHANRRFLFNPLDTLYSHENSWR